jgi:hypothetical protein
MRFQLTEACVLNLDEKYLVHKLIDENESLETIGVVSRFQNRRSNSEMTIA